MSAFDDTELAILMAIGARPGDEFPDGFAAISDEAAREAAEVAALIGSSLEPVEPPAALKKQLVAILKSGGKRTHTRQGQWREIFPGIRLQELASNHDRNSVTLLLQMEPGSLLPGHGHVGTEESYVITGSCTFGDVQLEEGDFFYIAAGQRHGDVASTGGCLLVVVADPVDFAAVG